MSELRTLKMENTGAGERDLVLQALHDLRSPLSVLKILLARLERSREAYSPDLVAAVFERIESISESMLKSAAPAAQDRMRSIPQAIHAVLREKTVEYEDRVHFTSSVSPDVANLQIDSREIMRMISNLINNAVEAGATCIAIEAERCADSIHISVSDDGRGFSESALADLTSGISHLVSRPGHGFGLRHAQKLATALNGRLWIRSAPQRGSCITLSLPDLILIQGVEV